MLLGLLIRVCHICVGQLYAVQQGIKLAKGDASAKSYLLQIMDQAEVVRCSHPCLFMQARHGVLLASLLTRTCVDEGELERRRSFS